MKNARYGVDKREGVCVLVFRDVVDNPSVSTSPIAFASFFFEVIYDCGAHCDREIALTLQETRTGTQWGPRIH